MKRAIKIFATIGIVGIMIVGGGNLVSQNSIVDTPDDCPFYYMKEGKIYYQDEEVFLKTCNYVISLVVDPATNELLVGPYTLYFNYAYSDNQAELTKHLHAHFKLIKDMGFNSVRIMNASIQPRHDSDNKLAIKSLNWPLPTYSDPIPNATTTGNTCFNYENLVII